MNSPSSSAGGAVGTNCLLVYSWHVSAIRVMVVGLCVHVCYHEVCYRPSFMSKSMCLGDFTVLIV